MHTPPLSHEQPTPAEEHAEVAPGKRATRLAFFMAGFALSSWAPLVPFVQHRLGMDASGLAGILLCLGLGAVVGMPLAGALAMRMGPKALVAGGCALLAMALPMLALLHAPFVLALSLFGYGLALGAIDVAANIHGLHIQQRAKTPLMSGFHGCYSLGGLVGVAGLTALLSGGMPVAHAACVASLTLVACLLGAWSGFSRPEGTTAAARFPLPRGKVLAIGGLAGLIFLVEGAMLDWAAILLVERQQLAIYQSGMAYALFAAAMLIARLVGDRVVVRYGKRAVVMGGTCLTAVGLAAVVLAPGLTGVWAGTLLAGLAAGNLVPVLFSLAGEQPSMPAPQAIAAVSMLGYLGVLLGPALIGCLADVMGLAYAFLALAALTLLACAGVPRIFLGTTDSANA